MDLAQHARTVFLARMRRIVAEAESPAEAAEAILAALDQGHDPEASEDSPGWALVEVDPDTGDETGRDLTGLLATWTAPASEP